MGYEKIRNECNLPSTTEDDLNESCKKFINKLKDKYNYFIKKVNNELDSWEVLIKNDKNNILISEYVPENCLIKSPMCLLEGKWGCGKTFFINYLIKSIISNKLPEDDIFFSKIIVLDVIKIYSADYSEIQLINVILENIYESIDRNISITDIARFSWVFLTKICKSFSKINDIY